MRTEIPSKEKKVKSNASAVKSWVNRYPFVIFIFLKECLFSIPVVI